MDDEESEIEEVNDEEEEETDFLVVKDDLALKTRQRRRLPPMELEEEEETTTDNGDVFVGQQLQGHNNQHHPQRHLELAAALLLVLVSAIVTLRLKRQLMTATTAVPCPKQSLLDPPSDLSKNDYCVFVLATPGSGSSTMLNLIEECRIGNSTCRISGENWGSIQELGRFHESLIRTDKQWRGNDHEREAWKKQWSNVSNVIQVEHQLIKSMLNPPDDPDHDASSSSSSSCWGFKEIRYGRYDSSRKTLNRDVEFLQGLCEHPKIIFHTRRNVSQTFASQVLRQRPQEQQASILQHRCFDTFTKTNTTSEKMPECVSMNNKVKAASSDMSVFRFYLDDYLEGNSNYEKLWKDFLGCRSPMPPPRGNELRPTNNNNN